VKDVNVVEVSITSLSRVGGSRSCAGPGRSAKNIII
jgi:hypothetical protein